MTQLFVWLQNRFDFRDEEGQTAVEYALVIALVAFAIVTALALMPGDPFGSFWTSVKTKLTF
jgi:Flp pilus assembly pilin Flp